MKTSELTGAALDWAVAMCLGHRVAEIYGPYIRIHLPDGKQAKLTLAFCPSTDWSIGGPLIEQELIQILVLDSCIPLFGADTSYCGETYKTEGPTPLVAAMRCYVASHLGDQVEVPSELIGVTA